MPFRQRNKDPEITWRKRSRMALIAAGLPNAVIDDERRWTYVLLHGADEFVSGWSPRDITPQQAGAILSLLEAHYNNEAGLDLFRALRDRVNEK